MLGFLLTLSGCCSDVRYTVHPMLEVWVDEALAWEGERWFVDDVDWGRGVCPGPPTGGVQAFVELD